MFFVFFFKIENKVKQPMMLLFFSYKNKTPNVYLKTKLKKKKKTNSYKKKVIIPNYNGSKLST